MKLKKQVDEDAIELRERIEAMGAVGVKLYDTDDGASVILSREPLRPGQPVADHRWHLSVARPERLPTWEEMMAVRDALPQLADVFMALPAPPREYWLNVHEYCLHLWEITDAGLIAQWKADGERARAMGTQ